MTAWKENFNYICVVILIRSSFFLLSPIHHSNSSTILFSTLFTLEQWNSTEFSIHLKNITIQWLNDTFLINCVVFFLIEIRSFGWNSNFNSSIDWVKSAKNPKLRNSNFSLVVLLYENGRNIFGIYIQFKIPSMWLNLLRKFDEFNSRYNDEQYSKVLKQAQIIRWWWNIIYIELLLLCLIGKFWLCVCVFVCVCVCLPRNIANTMKRKYLRSLTRNSPWNQIK